MAELQTFSADREFSGIDKWVTNTFLRDPNYNFQNIPITKTINKNDINSSSISDAEKYGNSFIFDQLRQWFTDTMTGVNSAYNINRQYDDQVRKEVFDYNSAEALKQRQWSSKEAEINRLFQQTSADKAMAFSADEAELNRQFQERMSNTAYQRARQDMELAGINPILAYTQGGATVPSGGTGTGFSSSGSTVSGSSASSAIALSSREGAQGAVQIFNGLLSGALKALDVLIPW